jgi:hypothetical protein
MKDRGQSSEALFGPMPDLRRRAIRTAGEAAVVRAIVLKNVERTAVWVRSCKDNPLDLLTALRFQMVGCDPISGKALNIIEQINQTFTILASLRAVERLIEMHPEAKGFRLALGACSGRDIQSVEPDLVAAEVFCATHPGSNQKLKKDIARLKAETALHRYVFFAAPHYRPGRQADLETEVGIEVHCVEI